MTDNPMSENTPVTGHGASYLIPRENFEALVMAMGQDIAKQLIPNRIAQLEADLAASKARELKLVEAINKAHEDECTADAEESDGREAGCYICDALEAHMAAGGSQPDSETGGGA